MEDTLQIIENELEEIYVERGKIDLLLELSRDIQTDWTAVDMYEWVISEIDKVRKQENLGDAAN